MNKLFRSFSAFFLLIFILLGLSTYAHAAVFGDDNVINGLFTQESINQTNKSEYADRSGSENIDEVTGSLTWKSNQIRLQGIEGLDLNIGVIYQSNQAFGYMRHYNSSGGSKKYNYLISRYDLGQGWSFRFPSVQLTDGYTYYHTGEGAIYRVDFTATGASESFTHLLGYQGKDIQFSIDTQESFNNGQATSSFYLEYDSKKREYFAADGRLLGIVDRYGNTLTFQHQDRVTYDGQTNKVISSIKDSVGRTVNFSYTTNLQTVTDDDFSSASGEKITVTVDDPSGNFVESVVYTKWRQKMIINELPDGYAPFLRSIQNQNSDYTYFNYETKAGRFNHQFKSYENSSANSSTVFTLLKEISSDRTKINYLYELTNRNLGPLGISEDYRVIQRYTQLIKSSGAFGDYNHLNYTYTNDYTGYPNYSNPYDLPASYTFSSQSKLQSNTRTNDLASISTFNGKQQPTLKETRTATGERKVTSYLAFHSIFTQLPTELQLSDYASNDTDSSASKLIVKKTYTDWGALASETKPVESGWDHPRFFSNITYEPNFHQIESKKTYQDLDTPLVEIYSYDANGRLRTYKNPKGEVTTTWYETIDTNGNVMNNSDEASTVLKGKVRKVVTSKPIEKGKTSQSITHYSANMQYAYPTEITTSFTTNDGNQQPVSQTIKKSMSYNIGTGFLQEETDGNNNKTSYTYDALGRLLTVKYPDFTNNSGERYAVSDVLEYGVGNDTMLAADDPENSDLRELSVYSYRKYTRLSNNSVTTINQSYSFYDGMGNMRKISRHDPQSNTFVDARYHYDDQGRVSSVRDVMGNISTASYDMWGNQDEIIDSFGNLHKTERLTTPIRRITTYFVAAADINAYRTDPTRSDLKSQYVEQFFDEWGQTVRVRTYKDWPNKTQPITEEYWYNEAGNVSAYTDPNKNVNDAGFFTKSYTYDELNRLKTVEDAMSQYTNVEFNKLGNVTELYMHKSGQPEMTLTTKQYNEIGALDSKKDAVHESETYFYNGLGQMIGSKDRMGATTATQYDTQGRITSTRIERNGINQEIKTNIGSEGILYDTTETFLNGISAFKIKTGMDTNKRVTSINQTANNYSSSLKLSYNPINQITKQFNESAGFTVNFQYKLNRLDKVQINGKNSTDDSDQANIKYSYYPNGQIDSISYPPLSDGSILSSKYTYDTQGRIKTLVNNKGGTSLSSYSYDYDFNGNIIEIYENTPLGNRSSAYSYDKLNRLEVINRSDGSTVRYTYDLLGNRTTQEDTKSLIFSLEENANNYDISNRLVDVAKGDITTSFAYSADGLRYKKTNENETIQYHYNVNGQVIAETNGRNVVEANYVRGDRLLVKNEATTGKSYYYLYNGHGDVVMMIDTNGGIVNQYQYDEWGNLLVNQETVQNSFKYAGEIYDEESGLYYLRARYYDPGMGRFINEDTYEGDISNPLSMNLYTYVHNNPLIYIDPTGFSVCEYASYCNDARDKGVNGMVVDTNQLLYLHSVVSSGSYGERAWAQNQLDLGLFYKEVVPKNADVERYVKGKVELSLILNTALEVSATDDNVELIFSYGVNGKIGVEGQIKGGVEVSYGDLDNKSFGGSYGKQIKKIGDLEGEFRMDNNGNVKGSFDIGMSKGFAPKVIDRDWGADFQKEYTTDDIYRIQLPAYDLKGAPHPDQALLFALWAHYSITRGIYEKIQQK